MTILMTALRTFNWRRMIRLRWLIAAALLLGTLALTALLALRLLRPAPPAQLLPGQLLAADIARMLAGSERVQLASGAYLPGDTLLLYTRTSDNELSRVRSWALVQLEPFAERLAAMPKGETLTWVIDYGPDPADQELLLVPLNRATEPSFYRYVSAAPVMSGLPTAEPVAYAPTAAPPAEPTTLPTPVPAQPPATEATADQLLSSSFDESGSGDSPWRPLSGTWVMAEGIYTQRDLQGYDYLSLLDLTPLAHYSVEVRLRLVGGEMGGGIIYNAPDLTTRGGAQIVDLDQQGAYLRWGRYEQDGTYRYEGGVTLDPPLNDGQWHNLRIVTHAAVSSVWLDGRQIGTISNTSSAGYVGLTTSQAQVDFDDMLVLSLPEAGDMPALPTVLPSSDLADDFADGDADGWQVLGGTWQVVDGEYQQSGGAGFDLASIATFRGERYRISVRLRQLDGTSGAGLLFNMARRDSKARSQIVNYAQGGKLLQWGHFDGGGNFVFGGSAPVARGSDEQWHTLTITVADGKASVSLDDEVIVDDLELIYTAGYSGLLAGAGSTAFDDVQIEVFK